MHEVPNAEEVRKVTAKAGFSPERIEEAVQLNNDPLFHDVFDLLADVPKNVLRGMVAGWFSSMGREEAMAKAHELVETARKMAQP